MDVLEYKFFEKRKGEKVVIEERMQNSYKMVRKREVTTDEWRGRYLIGTNYSIAAVSKNEAKWRGKKGADIPVIITSE